MVVAHADILRFITEGYNSGTFWANAEVREYTFEVDEEHDERGEAWVVLTKNVTKKGENEPSSSEIAQDRPIKVGDIDKHRPLYN